MPNTRLHNEPPHSSPECEGVTPVAPSATSGDGGRKKGGGESRRYTKYTRRQRRRRPVRNEAVGEEHQHHRRWRRAFQWCPASYACVRGEGGVACVAQVFSFL